MRPLVAVPQNTLSFDRQAEAIGDLDSLRAHHRHAIRVQLVTNQAGTEKAVVKALTPDGPTRRRTPRQERRRLLRHR